MSMARVLRFLAGTILAGLLLSFILPLAGIPSSHFLPPSHVWGQAKGFTRGVVIDKYYDVTNNPFNVGDQQFFADYQFKAKAPATFREAQAGQIVIYKGTVRVDQQAYELLKRPVVDKTVYKAKTPIPIIPGQFVRVRYEPTYPEVNGVTALASGGKWVDWGGRNIGAGGALFGTWLGWIVLALVFGYVFMRLMEKFSAQENI